MTTPETKKLIDARSPRELWRKKYGDEDYYLRRNSGDGLWHRFRGNPQRDLTLYVPPEAVPVIEAWIAERYEKPTERSRCGHCGRDYGERACGPTHALRRGRGLAEAPTFLEVDAGEDVERTKDRIQRRQDLAQTRDLADARLHLEDRDAKLRGWMIRVRAAAGEALEYLQARNEEPKDES